MAIVMEDGDAHSNLLMLKRYVNGGKVEAVGVK